MRSEKKHFNHQYIPIIIGLILFFVLGGLLIYFVANDNTSTKPSDSNKTTTTTKATDDLFEHEEMLVDTSSSTCKEKTLERYKEEANAIDLVYIVKEEDEGPGVDFDDGTRTELNVITKYVVMELKNVTENLRFEFKNDFDNKVQKVNGKDAKRGKIEIKKAWGTVNLHYTVDVYANDKCIKKPIRRFRINPPIYNYWHDRALCEKELKGTKYCDELNYGVEYTMREIVYAQKEAEKGSVDKDKTEDGSKTVISKIKDTVYHHRYMLIIISIIIIVLVGITITIRIIKKKGHEDIELPEAKIYQDDEEDDDDE